MLRHFNYTNRKTIEKGDVQVAIREVAGAPAVATVAVALNDYKLPEEADLFVEAYRKSTYMRSRIGTVGDHPERFEFALDRFDTPDGVRFRLKAVGRRDELGSDAPILLAAADQITPSDGDDQNQDLVKLMSLVPADLNGEVWRMNLTEYDRPVLLIERKYWDDRSFARSGWFFSLVVPTVFRRALAGALSDEYRELDEDNWRSQWLNYALSIPGEENLPDVSADPEVIDAWVNDRVETFCRSHAVCDRFEPMMKGSE